MSERNEVVIVGGGLAAAKAVESLRENGLETPEASHAKFAQLLEHQAAADATVLLDDLVLEVYGVRLSADSGTVDSLEWRFLNWLGTKRK